MSFDINFDVAIVVGFLLVTLIVGVITGRGIKNISQYAIGNRNFATITISATIIATWISGGIFFPWLYQRHILMVYIL